MKKIIALFCILLFLLNIVPVSTAQEKQTEYWGVVVVALDQTLEPYLYDALIQIDSWQDGHLKLLWKNNATKHNIQESIQWLSENADENDIVLFSFDGHGSYINQSYGIYATDGDIPIDVLNTYLDSINTQAQVLIFDCCFSGTFQKTLNKENRVILQSTLPYGLGSHWVGNNIFTGPQDVCLSSKLAEAINQRIDTNNDQITSAEETFYYAKDKLTFRYSLPFALRPLLQLVCKLAYGHFYLPFATLSDNYPGELPLITN